MYFNILEKSSLNIIENKKNLTMFIVETLLKPTRSERKCKHTCSNTQIADSFCSIFGSHNWGGASFTSSIFQSPEAMKSLQYKGECQNLLLSTRLGALVFREKELQWKAAGFVL